jgi:hypothetical protein
MTRCVSGEMRVTHREARVAQSREEANDEVNSRREPIIPTPSDRDPIPPWGTLAPPSTTFVAAGRKDVDGRP